MLGNGQKRLFFSRRQPSRTLDILCIVGGQSANWRTAALIANYGFEKVERLSGNLGYLDLRGFMDPEMGGDTVAGAMALLAIYRAVFRRRA